MSPFRSGPLPGMDAWGRPIPRLGGTAELCEELDITRQRLAELRVRVDFPHPVLRLASGSLYDLDDVADWAGSTLRRGPGRPRRDATQSVLGGRYRLDGILGSGSFADVYRAEDLATPDPTRAAAIKILRDPDVEGHARRFDRELAILRETVPPHPNVVPILSHGVGDDGRPWYAMPLAVGTLLDEIRAGAPSPDRVIDAIRHIGAGLSHIHAQNVMHRDLSPTNVLRMDTGALALSDFGLARVGAPTESASAVIGTRAYAAPEVAVGARASARTEVFALGKLLLHLVSGTRPEPGIPDAVAIPGDQFRPIIQRATQPTPAARYASVPEFLADLEERVTSVRMKTERPDDTMRRLREVLRNQQQPTIVTLRELLQTALGPAREQIFRPGQPYRDSLPDAIAYLSRDAIQTLWTEAPEDLVKLVEAYSAYTASARGFPLRLLRLDRRLLRSCGDDDGRCAYLASGGEGLAPPGRQPQPVLCPRGLSRAYATRPNVRGGRLRPGCLGVRRPSDTALVLRRIQHPDVGGATARCSPGAA